MSELGSAGAGVRPPVSDVAAFVAWMREQYGPSLVPSRASFENQARALLDEHAGAMDVDQAIQLGGLFNSGEWRGELKRNRFSPAFAGGAMNTLVKRLDVFNECTERLWRSSVEDALAATGEILRNTQVLPGAGRSYPTMLLYLRDPAQYVIWLKITHRGLVALDRLHESNDRKGGAPRYLAYVAAARTLADEYGLEPQEIDAVLAEAGRQAPMQGGVESSHRYWWVNQGLSFAPERSGGYVWAPKQIKTGASLSHHTNVASLEPGDVLFHYKDSAVRAVGLVVEGGHEAPNPMHDTNGPWAEDGYQAGVEYFDVAPPLALGEVDIARRLAITEGPFDKHGGVKQGYLFPLPDDFAGYLRTLLGSRWPGELEGPAGGAPPPENSLMQPELGGQLEDLTPSLVHKYLEDRQLHLEPSVVAAAVAALRSGKHLLLTGPPGTGKTELGFALGEAATELGITAGFAPTTATADWTSVETVGGYRMSTSGGLEFSPGVVLQAIETNRWLLIDEFNRADIDKAVGQLFSVLSGQAITLPFVQTRDGVEAPPSIVPPGAAAPIGSHPYTLDPRWRIIATLNNRDRDLLFNMSYALLRRFAIVEVPAPNKERFASLLGSKAPTGDDQLDAAIHSLISLPYRPLSPAILIDCGRYLAARRAVATEPHGERTVMLREMLTAYVLPQLDDLAAPQLQAVVGYLHKNTVPQMQPSEIAALVAAAVHAAAEDITPKSAPNEDGEAGDADNLD